MHVHIRLLLFFATMLLFCCRPGDWRPWLLVLLATLGNEASSLTGVLVQDNPVSPIKHFHDIWNTMFWPTLLTIWGR